jgi:hypothetical protein
VEPILDFIGRLGSYENVETITNGMSTQVFGEYGDVMGAIGTEMERSMQRPYAVFVMKVVNADLR